MFVHARQDEILKHLQREPRLGVEELRQRLEVSRSTLRRDLLELEERGELLRVHGGVLHPDHVRGEPTVEARRARSIPAKQAIAAAAADLVPQGATVFVDAGTTCLELGRRLSLREDIRLYTNSIPLLVECGGNAASLTCVGGEFRHAGQSTVGALALSWLENLRFDFAFLGASGVRPSGPHTTEMTEASMKRAAVQAADTGVLLADASKWEHSAPVRFCKWASLDHWVVDASAPRNALRSVRAAGVRVKRANDAAN